MRRIVASVFIAVIVLAAALATGLTVGSMVASDENPPDSSGVSPDGVLKAEPPYTEDTYSLRARAQTDEDVHKMPYIGILVRALSDSEAEELGVAGGVEVKRVMDDGPASEVLEPGDVIVAVNGQELSSARDLVRIIKESTPGDVLQLTLHGHESPIEITVGERPFVKRQLHPRGRPLHRECRRHHPHPKRGLSKFVSSEYVVQTDDGLKTFKAVAGTTTAVDPELGTLTLAPKDGTGESVYMIPDDGEDHPALISDGHKVELDGLAAEEPTLVVTVNGAVKLVVQGDPPARVLRRLRFLGPPDKRHDRHECKIRPRTGFHGGDGIRKPLDEFRGSAEIQEQLRGLREELERRFSRGPSVRLDVLPSQPAPEASQSSGRSNL